MIHRSLQNYCSIVGEDVVDELRALAGYLAGRSVCHVNSTSVGGGVAEILHWMVPLMNDLGLRVRWDVIKGGDSFFDVTKAMHNALHGKPGSLTEGMKSIFLEETENNLNQMTLDDDFTIVHDPQPAGLIRKRSNDARRWIWRCHIDLSRPNEEHWGFLEPFIERFDAAVFSSPSFSRQLTIPQYLVSPSIDPLNDKNCDLEDREILSVLEKHHIDPERPILTQISRFDYLKDPVGVIEAYRIVRKSADAQLVLAGGSADDDPEGKKVLAEVLEKASGDGDIHVLSLPPTAHREINALQRASTVVIQKSLKEGFGLTVTEAMWKGKPVVAGAVGGIPLQVRPGVNGLLVHSVPGTARAIQLLLANPDVARKMGRNGREHVRQNFLLTRHVRDYLLLMLAVDRGQTGLVYL